MYCLIMNVIGVTIKKDFISLATIGIQLFHLNPNPMPQLRERSMKIPLLFLKLIDFDIWKVIMEGQHFQSACLFDVSIL